MRLGISIFILCLLNIHLAFAVPVEQEFDGIDFVQINAQPFVFGSPSTQSYYMPNESERVIPFDHSFWISKYEISQSEWMAVMGQNPSSYVMLNGPVETVTWHQAKDFVTALNQQAGGQYYRLPTEAEWEYVARAGQSTIWSFGDVLADLFNYVHLNVGHLPQAVGQKQANAWGVYDLYGNVSEWCEDWYQYGLSYSFGGCPPQQGTYKVFRGGSNGIGPQWLRSSSRNFASPDFRMYNVGIRVVRVDDPSSDPFQPGQDCTPQAFCGDRIVNGSEQCDDGNIFSGDGCSELCEIEAPAPPAPPAQGGHPNAPADAPCHQAAGGCPELEWVEIQGGSFMMGSNFDSSSQPIHQVNVPTFLMMKTEITVGMYRACVEAGACSVPVDPNNYGDMVWTNNIGNKENYPVGNVSWHQIMDFATWTGARLPSESEWEYAARNQGQAIVYPWGNFEPDCTYANFNAASLESLNTESPNENPCNGAATAAVCATERGNTEQGLCDMMGNIGEWVQDELDVNNFNYIGTPNDGSGNCSVACPRNTNDVSYSATSNIEHVTRGNFFISYSFGITTSHRSYANAFFQETSVGGRLARSINTQNPPPLPVCGNNLVEVNEQCDDGNTVSSDGCSATCEIEQVIIPSVPVDAPCHQAVGGCPEIEWVEIRGGFFEMNSLDPGMFSSTVLVPTFLMMKTEITVGMYRACVNAGVCSVPADPQSLGHMNWTDVIGNKETHPINYISWHQIMVYAAWVGARLPSESEWEYAARSEGQQNLYPWGNSEPDCNYGDFYTHDEPDCNGEGTSPVCSTEIGNTQQGLCDMAGNLFEWVQDEEHETLIGAPTNGSGWCTGECPINASDLNYNSNDNSQRMLRGGSFELSGSSFARTDFRYGSFAFEQFIDIGGRLARSISYP